jgi:hypothetical protein
LDDVFHVHGTTDNEMILDVDNIVVKIDLPCYGI